MGSPRIRRINNELDQLVNSDELVRQAINFELVNDDFSELLGEIAGPPDSPYEGGRFQIEIKLPEDYPFMPPKVRFITRIWHPNISIATGVICSEMFQGGKWSPAMTLRTTLLSIQMFLANPDPDFPQDVIIARQCKEKPEIYRKTAQHWTCVYAGGQNSIEDFEQMVQQLKDMGISESSARDELSASDWDLTRATQQIFGE